MKLHVFFLALLVASAFCQPLIKLKKADKLSYKLAATVDLSSTKTAGHSGSFQAVFWVQVNAVSGSGASAVYTCVSNMYNGVSNGEYLQGLGDGNPLGTSVSFKWKATGEIFQINANPKDEPIYAHLKLLALDSLSNTLLPVGTNKKIKESSVLGVHNTNYKGTPEANYLTVTGKSFGSADVVSYTDKTLDPKSVTLQASGNAKLHSLGHVHTASHSRVLAMRPVNVPAVAEDYSDEFVSKGKVSLTLLTRLAANNAVTWIDPAINNAPIEAPEIAELLASEAAHFDSLTEAATQYLTIGDESFEMEDDNELIWSTEALLDRLSDESIYQDTLVLQEIIDEADKTVKTDETVFKQMAALANANKGELTQAIVFILTGSSSDLAASALIDLVFDNSLTISYLAARTAIFSEKPAVVEALIQRAMIPDEVGNFLLSVDLAPLESASNGLAFNKEWSYAKKVGGKTAGVQISTKVQASSNLNCKNPTFDYMARAQANADILILGRNVRAVDALAEYGKVGGVPLQNTISVKIFKKEIYKKTLPGVNRDCSVKTIPVAQIAPGAKFSYTVWVIVPIKITASANLNAKLNLQYSLCDTDLSAMMRVVPTVGVTIAGSASCNLFLVKAGATLKGQFDISIYPEAYVKGTKCLVGLDVKMVHRPLIADLSVYVKKRSCKVKFLKIKCKWKNAANKTLFHWAKAAKESLLYQKQWPIAK
ncbi:hypothetical protein RCL1_005955 [Eukaryota sp. TZLM3-RCL]